MDNPSVWQFEEPPATITTSKYANFEGLQREIDRFTFTHLVAVVLPDCLRLPRDLADRLTVDSDYYRVANLNLAELVDATFFNCFIKNGELSLLSVDSRIDSDNCCAVTPDSCLVLSLTRDAYQSCGLEGHVSHLTHRNKDRYVVTVKLTGDGDGRQRERTRKALATLPPFAVIVSWQPRTDHVCPSSVAKYFRDRRYDVTLATPHFRTHVTYSVPAARLDVTAMTSFVTFAEWLGVVAVEGATFGNAADYVNSLEGEEEEETMLGQTRVMLWRGFYRSKAVADLLRLVRQYGKEEGKVWTAAYTQGFTDAPIVEGRDEHNFLTNGDNGNLYIFQNDHCVLNKLRCSVKRLK